MTSCNYDAFTSRLYSYELIPVRISCSQSSFRECVFARARTSRDAHITHRVILRGLNAVTGFPRQVSPRTGVICIFREDHYPARKSPSIKSTREKEREREGGKERKKRPCKVGNVDGDFLTIIGADNARTSHNSCARSGCIDKSFRLAWTSSPARRETTTERNLCPSGEDRSAN